MRTAGRPSAVVTMVLLLATSATAAAQARADRRGYVAVKGGLNHEEAEDGLIGSSAAVGIAAGLSIRPVWTLEFEVWRPAYIRNDSGDPKHRDTQVSVSFIRSFRTGAWRPYALTGFSAAFTTTFLTACVADRAPFPPVADSQPIPTIVGCSEPGVHQRVRERYDSSSGYLLLGSGLEVRLGRVVRLAPEVRVHIAPTSVILRPALGVVIGF